MLLVIPAETRPGERRVAAVPATVPKLIGLGYEVVVEAGAGRHALATDTDYEKAGARVTADLAAELGQADVVASVRPLDPDRVAALKSGALSVSFLQPARDLDTVRAVVAAGGSVLSFDLLPRISRAQAADALTSQALVGGYRAMLVGAGLLPRFLPLFMTAAGTIRPATVLVLGAGVAGLQAMATAKKLGAVVQGYDVRPASAAEVQSVGAKFIELDLPTLDGGGGYAKEMAEERAIAQRQLLAPYVAAADIVITTAAVPGRQAPLLVTRNMVQGMRAGSAVVDLAAETGGNVEGSVPGEIVDIDGVKVWGAKDMASALAPDASFLFAGNVVSLLGFTTKEGAVSLDIEDEVISGSAVVLDGEVVNDAARAALQEG